MPHGLQRDHHFCILVYDWKGYNFLGVRNKKIPMNDNYALKLDGMGGLSGQR